MNRTQREAVVLGARLAACAALGPLAYVAALFYGASPVLASGLAVWAFAGALMKTLHDVGRL